MKRVIVPAKTVHGVLKTMLEKVEPVDFRSIVNRRSIRNKHYQIVSIDNLLSIAQKNNWGLCQRDAFIYIYNGEYWNCVDERDFRNFLGYASYKMGVDRIEAKHYLFQDGLLKQFHTSAHRSTSAKDKETVLINLKNGTYQVTSNGGQLCDFNPEDFLTYQLPFEFDPMAEAPMFHKYLNEVLPDANLRNVLCEYLGYVFVRNLKLEKCLLLYGNGANGKSVFFDIVNALLGKENVSNFSLGNLAEEHNRALIINKLLNYGSEIRGNIESDIFKQLVSGEPVQCRMKYGNSFFIEDYARLCFNCNELPKEVEHTEAFFRRFMIVPFHVTIPESQRDPELAKKIIANELSGVFNWVLQGIDRLVTQRRFTNCDAVKRAVEEYKQQSDSVHLFVSEEGYIKSNDSFVLLKNLYPLYRNFCLSDGYRPLSKTNFKKRLESLGYETERKNLGVVVFLKIVK